MGIFVKEKKIDFDGNEVVVNEIGVAYLYLSDEEKQDAKKLLELHTSLSAQDIQKLTIPAFNKILDAFYELNDEHFGTKDEQGEEEGK